MLQAAGRKCVPPRFFLCLVSLFFCLTCCPNVPVPGYLIQHCLRSAIFACLVDLCLVREMWCLCFCFFWGGGFVGFFSPFYFCPKK